MIQEAYCSKEVSKLLREKGFNEFCYTYYDNTDDSIKRFNKGLHFNNTSYPWGVPYDINDVKKYIIAPTHQMAMKWLREVHKLAFIISPQWAEGDMRNPCRWYWEIRGLEDIGLDVYSNPLCNTYEEAVEAALKYILENLI